jgi:Uma2 family endonuclease
MASAPTLARAIAPDTVLSFEINPGTLLKFLEARAEKGPRLKCFEGSVTLVSPGMPHERELDRLSSLVKAICFALRIKLSALRSTTWYLPLGVGDKENQPPDLAIEVVVSNPATKAMHAGAFLKIPELWVFDVPRRKLTFYHLVTRGKHQGTYRPSPRSRAFPVLTSADVLERLEDPEDDDIAFGENCREWARRVLVPRHQPKNGEG